MTQTSDKLDCAVPISLWLTNVSQINDADLLDEYEQWLSTDELSRMHRFRFAKDRHRFLVCRALMRHVLGNELNVPPGNVNFVSNKWGKPELNGAVHSVLTGLYFNLSHSDALGVFAVSKCAEVGVDVENLQRRVEILQLARRYFSAGECLQIEAFSGEEQRESFFAFWTLKEAYIKAVGKGLSIPLDSFSYHLHSDDIEISFKDMQDDAKYWQFYRFSHENKYRLALAHHSKLPLGLTAFSGVPLRGFTEIKL